MILVCDIECNSLTPDVIWCISTLDHDTKEIKRWTNQTTEGVSGTIEDGIAFMKSADTVVFHNGIGFDLYWLYKLHGLVIHPDKVVDTLLLSRLLYRNPKGHSLQEWGERLGIAKGDFTDYENFSVTMMEYCDQDVRVTDAVYTKMMKEVDEKLMSVLLLEQRFNFITTEMTQGGVSIDRELANKIYNKYKDKMTSMEQEFQKMFPPIIETRYSTKTGKKLKDKIHEFNPNSNDMVSEVLVKHCGYKGKRRTATGKLIADEIALKSVDHEYAKKFLEYRKLKKLCNTFYSDRDSGWLDLADDNDRVHHILNSLRAATGRCSHSRPNVTLVDKSEKEMREWIIPDEGQVMVGADASTLELRILSNYLFPFDNGRYADMLLNGTKEEGTDAHSVTAKTFGISRDDAKTLVYAYIYGAGDGKLMQVLKDAGSFVSSPSEAARKIDESIVGLTTLINKVKLTFHKRGFVRTPTGFIIPKPSSPHASLNYLIQGTGACIMKKAIAIFHFEKAWDAGYVDKETLRPKGFRYLLQCHDDLELTADKDIADNLGKLVVESITEAGKQLGINCPMTGDYSVGNNWAEVH